MQSICNMAPAKPRTLDRYGSLEVNELPPCPLWQKRRQTPGHSSQFYCNSSQVVICQAKMRGPSWCKNITPPHLWHHHHLRLDDQTIPELNSAMNGSQVQDVQENKVWKAQVHPLECWMIWKIWMHKNAMSPMSSDVSSKVSLLTRAYWRTTCRRCVKNRKDGRLEALPWLANTSKYKDIQSRWANVSNPAPVWNQCGTEMNRTNVEAVDLHPKCSDHFNRLSFLATSLKANTSRSSRNHTQQTYARNNKDVQVCTSNLQIKMH